LAPDVCGIYVRVEDERVFTGEVRLELLKAVLEKKKKFRFMAYGSSMFPFIRDQDILTIAPLPATGLVPGDVVAFEISDHQKLIIHRIVQCGTASFILRGDNRKGSDGSIPIENILGIVTRVERNGSIISAGSGRGRGMVAFFSRHGLLQRISWVMRLPEVVRAARGQKNPPTVDSVPRHTGSHSGNTPGP
jgi:hypothetical protein